MIDSSRWSVLEAGSMRSGQRHSSFDQPQEVREIPAASQLVKRYGAAVVVWPSMNKARPTHWSARVRFGRCYKLLTETIGFPGQDISSTRNPYRRHRHRGAQLRVEFIEATAG